MCTGRWQYEASWGRGGRLYGDLRWAAGKPYAVEEEENTWRAVMVASRGQVEAQKCQEPCVPTGEPAGGGGKGGQVGSGELRESRDKAVVPAGHPVLLLLLGCAGPGIFKGLAEWTRKLV